jgi:hypothetical protein
MVVSSLLRLQVNRSSKDYRNSNALFYSLLVYIFALASTLEGHQDGLDFVHAYDSVVSRQC